MPFVEVTAVDVPTETTLVADVEEFQKVILHSPGGTMNSATVELFATGICPITYATKPLAYI